MDGLSLLAVKSELEMLVDGKVDKIQQPERESILLTIRACGGNHRLLLCAHPENGRVQLTKEAYPNPAEAPAFCMLLRRRLVGGRIRAVVQENLDRLLYMQIEARDDLGDAVLYRLYVELMGRHSNVCLVNEKGVLVDCARHVGPHMSSVRTLLPGVAYTLPPAQEKKNPLETGEDGFFEALRGRGSLKKLLMQQFYGLSPDCACQLVARWAGEGDVMAETLTDVELRAFAHVLYSTYQGFQRGVFAPTLVVNAHKEPLAAYPFVPAASSESCVAYSDMCGLLDAYYAGRDQAERFRRRSASLQKLLQNHLERAYKKLAVYEQAKNQNEGLEQLRLQGELLMANVHTLQRGMPFACVENYYLDPPEAQHIPLDERLSPQENAQRYFKRYQKGKAAKSLAVAQCEQTSAEIQYLEGQQSNLEACTTDVELQEMKEELAREGYIKLDKKKQAGQKQPPSKPLHVTSSDGCAIYIGKNNRQNDYLTLQFAKSEDWWMHAKNIPGSHVIVRAAEELPSATLLEAAMLAAYYSKARASASVPVDYCQRKFVKKPAGAKPGMVIYTTNRTIYVTPDEGAIKRLQQP